MFFVKPFDYNWPNNYTTLIYTNGTNNTNIEKR